MRTKEAKERMHDGLAGVRRILAVDPGATSGWALFEDGVLVQSGVVKSTDRPGGGKEVDIVDAFRVFCGLAGLKEEGTLVIEDQFGQAQVKRKKLVRGEDGKEREVEEVVETGLAGYTRTVEARQTWEVFASMYRWKRVRIMAVTWQSEAGYGRKKRKERKELSLADARKHAPGIKNENEADAVCLGLWAVRTARRKQLLGGEAREAPPPMRGGRRACSRRQESKQ